MTPAPCNRTAVIALMDKACLPKPPLTLTASVFVSPSHVLESQPTALFARLCLCFSAWWHSEQALLLCVQFL